MASNETEDDPFVFPSVEEIRHRAEMFATAIDFEKLVADGILRKRGAWWQILDWDRLPEHANCKIVWLKTGHLVKFTKPSTKLRDWMARNSGR